MYVTLVGQPGIGGWHHCHVYVKSKLKSVSYRKKNDNRELDELVIEIDLIFFRGRTGI